ncbi:MAG: PD40 domain-containing protein [Cryomorphaceae bacterium]|nr:PD40 domain-containing protein [Cryomorphaceae bacterium]
MEADEAPEFDMTPNRDLIYPKEKYFSTIRQLTFGGDNAEAYWSFDNTKMTFQSNNFNYGLHCDQIYYMDLNTFQYSDGFPPRISTGFGRTTCAYFMPGDTAILYASTHLQDMDCPPEPDKSEGYVWPIYDIYDIFVANLRGEIVHRLTERQGYDAEATVSPKGDLIVFTSDRSGDLELWTMNIDGSDKKQVTSGLGYDGGAFFSPDGSRLVFRASRPKTEEEIKTYKELLKKGLVKPTEMEIYTCKVDGSDLQQVTNLGGANWAPFYHPSGEKILFSSNHHSKKGFPFNIFMINVDGTGLEQITFDDTFDAFPMFSFDGKKLLFSSNRFNGGTRETNVFVVDWVEP